MAFLCGFSQTWFVVLIIVYQILSRIIKALLFLNGFRKRAIKHIDTASSSSAEALARSASYITQLSNNPKAFRNRVSWNISSASGAYSN